MRTQTFKEISLLFLVFAFLFSACKKKGEVSQMDEDPNIVGDGVHVDIGQFPYPNLSDYQFFIGDIVDHTPNDRVFAYRTTSKLFTDYAKKKRFVYIPSGKKMSYVSDDELFNMPVGTVLIKSFFYEKMQPNNQKQILETRVMLNTQSGWEFAEYVWNDAQDDAVLQMEGQDVAISWDQDGTIMNTDYRIPSETECMICHKFEDNPIPIGLKPQNIDGDFDYGNGPENQIEYFMSTGILANNIPANIEGVVDYMDATEPLEKRMRSYLDINCAHCHREGSHCSYRPLRLAFSETDISSNMGVCVEPDEFINSALTHIIVPANKERSVMYYRLQSTDQNEMMPLLGRSVVHEEGLQLIQDYINSISGTCQ